MKIQNALFISICLFSGFITPLSGVEADELIRLKKAGVSESVIELVLNEKIFETCALTADDIIELKKAGFSDTLISASIWRKSFSGRERTKTYTNSRGTSEVNHATLEDLERLKEDGFSDDIIKAVVDVQTEDSAIREQNQMMRMFESMELSIQAGKSEYEFDE